MDLGQRVCEWIEPVERWLHRFYLLVWIVSLLVSVLASAATIVAGHLQAIPPYWVIPAALAAASLPFFLANQVAAWRKRRQDQTVIPVTQPGRPFPTRTIITVFVLLAIVGVASISSLIHTFAPSTPVTPSTSAAGSHPPVLGLAAASPIIDDLQQKTNALDMPEGWHVIITGPPDTGYLQTALKLILQRAIKKIRFEEPPNSSVNLDAPRVPHPQFSGIILHGDDTLTQAMMALGGCFKIQTTHVMLPGLAEYYHAKNLVWIEIGNGSPWHTPQVCTG
jgi:hypothetical protein